MAFIKEKPPVMIKVDKEKFNILLNILKVNELTNINEICEGSKKLQDKLLRYSVPKKEEDTGLEYINIGFYANEAKEIINQFLVFNSNEVSDKDYYSVLLGFREKYLNSRNTNVQN